MTDFERRSLELFEKRKKELLERNRKIFREWFLLFYEEVQMEMELSKKAG